MKLYARDVRTVIARLVLLVAVLIMPLGMTAAATHHQMAPAMPMKHCPDRAPNHDSKGAVAECTMACSSALPASEQASELPPRIICAPVLPAMTLALHGLHPDTATPPPKLS